MMWPGYSHCEQRRVSTAMHVSPRSAGFDPVGVILGAGSCGSYCIPNTSRTNEFWRFLMLSSSSDPACGHDSLVFAVFGHTYYGTSLCLKCPPPRRLHVSLSLPLLSAFRSQCSSFHAHPKHTASGSCTHLSFVASFLRCAHFAHRKQSVSRPRPSLTLSNFTRSVLMAVLAGAMTSKTVTECVVIWGPMLCRERKCLMRMARPMLP